MPRPPALGAEFQQRKGSKSNAMRSKRKTRETNEQQSKSPPPSPFWAVNSDHGLSFAGEETRTMV